MYLLLPTFYYLATLPLSLRQYPFFEYNYLISMMGITKNTILLEKHVYAVMRLRCKDDCREGSNMLWTTAIYSLLIFFNLAGRNLGKWFAYACPLFHITGDKDDIY